MNATLILAPVYRATTKEFILAVLTVAAGAANAYLWQRTFFAGLLGSTSFYSLPVAALLLAALLFACSAAFIRTRPLRILTSFLAVAIGYLLVPPEPTVFIALGLAAAGGMYAAGQIVREEQEAVSFSIRKIFRSGLPMFFTVTALMLAVFYFSSFTARPGEYLIPRTMFDAVVQLMRRFSGAAAFPVSSSGSPIAPLLSGIITITTNPNITINELILDQAGAQPGFAALSASQREELLRQGRAVLAEQFGITLTGNEKMGDILYQSTNTQLERFVGPYRDYLPFIAALGFFIAVKAVTLPVYWATLLLIFAVVKLLTSAGVLKKTTTTMQVERLEL